MDQIQVWERWAGFHWRVLHPWMLTSKHIVIFYSQIFCDVMSYNNERKMGTSMTQHIWCKDSELAPSQAAPDLESTPPQQHCAESGASTTLINEICCCLLIMLSESTLSCFLHAFYEINFHFQIGFPTSGNLSELSWPGWSWSVCVLTWARSAL